VALISGLLLVAVVVIAGVVFGHRQAAAGNPWLTPLPTQIGCAQFPGGEPSACDLLALPVSGPAFQPGVPVLRGRVRMTMIGARADRGTDDGRCTNSLYLEARFRNLTDHAVQLPPDGVNVIGPRGVYLPTSYFYAGESQITDFYGSLESPTTLHAGASLDVWTDYDIAVHVGLRFSAGWVNPWPEYLNPNHVTTPASEAVYRVAANGKAVCQIGH
jgi:hypothetical protein